MKVGIIGAGFTGLSAAYFLQKNNHDVTIIEQDFLPGGLAVGYKEKKWNWTLEKHYHHFFTNDKDIINLTREIGEKILVKRPKTSVLINEEIVQLDSPLKLLLFKKLNIVDRIRMAGALAILRYNPFWKPLEKYKAVDILPKIMGKKAYKLIWEPQLIGKFGKFSRNISLAWFWARIKKRTTQLAYPEKGFLNLAKKLSNIISSNGGRIMFGTSVVQIQTGKKLALVTEKNGKKEKMMFDAIIVTLPSSLFYKIAKEYPYSFKKNLAKRESLGAINLILRLKTKFIRNSTYWLSICEKNYPFTAIVEHTNFMGSTNYNKEHIVYVGKYLPRNHEYFSKNAKELLEIYDPYLKKINPEYRKDLINIDIFKAPFAQPIVTPNYSKKIPSFFTPIKNVYLANIEQVYPWDRGTNYAVSLGKKIAKITNENF